MKYVLIALGVVVALVIVLALVRMVRFRSSGSAVTLRKLPAEGYRGWRHGVFRYQGDNLSFFMLRSLEFNPDLTMNRTNVVLRGHRPVTPEEASFLSAREVLQFSYDGKDYELVGAPRVELAFLAWVEAAPDSRMDKMNPRDLLRQIDKDKS